MSTYPASCAPVPGHTREYRRQVRIGSGRVSVYEVDLPKWYAAGIFHMKVCRPTCARAPGVHGLTPPTSAPGLGSTRPHLRRSRAYPAHICAWTGLTPPTSAPEPGLPRPHPHQDRARPCPHLRRDYAHPAHIGTGTALNPPTSAPPRRSSPLLTSAPGLGPPPCTPVPGAGLCSAWFAPHQPGVPRVSQVWVADWRHVYIGSANMDWRSLSQVSHICAATGLTPAHICAGTALAT